MKFGKKVLIAFVANFPQRRIDRPRSQKTNCVLGISTFDNLFLLI
jgi:hypothetical protein